MNTPAAAQPSAPVCAAPSCHTAWLSSTPASWWWRIGISAFLAMNTMTVGLAVNTSESSPAERRVLHLILLALTLAVFALLGKPLLDGLAENWRSRRLSLEPLFTLGLSGAFAASLLALWRGQGPVYFEVSSILLVIYSLGKVITGEAEQRALQAVSLSAITAETCLVQTPGGQWTETPVRDVAAGDLIAVPAGSTVPVDGAVERGAALCRTSAITGESFLVPKAPGDPVPAGAIPTDAALRIRASAPGAERSLDRIADAIARSRATPSPSERAAARAALWLTPLVALASLLTAAFWLIRSGADDALMNGLAVLVIACPCALGFATPLALWAALARFALRGAWLRNGEALERLAGASLVIFDKTGTLTGAELRLSAFLTTSACPLSRETLLAAIAAAERLSGHPIAAAFHDTAGSDSAPLEVLDLRLLPGLGISAEVLDPGARRTFDLRLGLAEKLLPPHDAASWQLLLETARPAPGARLLAVLLDHRLAALAALEEVPLPGLPALWQGLREDGIQIMVVSGDAEDRVRALGCPDARFSLDPLQKLDLVQSLQARGHKVLFVGDGINDAAAMAAAHAALAIESGASIALDTARGILRPDAILRLPELLRIARAARQLARSNLLWAAAYNIAGISIAAAGLLHPVFAALVMTCSSLMVVWRAASFLTPDLEQPAP
jgi:heavy metal translocating P-type ATPase